MPQHIDFADAADLARGVLDPDRKVAIDAHVAACNQCAALVRWCAELSSVATRETDYAPPPSAVRLARALYDRRPESPLARVPRLIARLLGDTALDPVPVGVRSVRSVARHALFEAGGFSVDLRLEEDDATQQLVMVGQVLDPGGSAAPGQGAQAILVRASRVVASAAVNEFGEFRLDCTPARGLTLQVPIEGGARRIDVPVSPLVPARRVEREDAE